MQKIGFIKSENIKDLFGKELDRLRQAVTGSGGGDIILAEVSHKEVLRGISFLLAYNMVDAGRDIKEVFLKDDLPLPRPTNRGEIVFVYTLIEGIQDFTPLEISKDNENLLKRLNAMREVFANSSDCFIFWIYERHFEEFQRICKDIWLAKRGLYSFILKKGQSIEPLGYSYELSPAQAARLMVQAINVENELKTPGIPLTRKLSLHEDLVRKYQLLGFTKYAEGHYKKLLSVSRELKNYEYLLSQYLENLRHRYEWLEFKGIRQLKLMVKMRLEDLFVPLRFIRRIEISLGPEEYLREEKKSPKTRKKELGKVRESLGGKEQRISFKDLFRYKRAVVLGDPGSGKSTLLKYIAYRLAKEPEIAKRDFGLRDEYIPLIISVSSYSHFLNKDYTFSQFLRESYKELWPILKDYLKGGRLLLLIDGLDEEVDSAKRVQIAREIEEFVAKYPKNRFIITSRIAGYSIAAISMGFDHFIIQPFEGDDIKRFLLSWYKALGEERPEEQSKRLYQTIIDVPAFKRLAANPLLLSIMALIHHQGIRLPYRRVDLYGCILDALAETWSLARALSGRPIDLWLGNRRLDRTLVERILAPIAFEVHKTSPGGIMTKDFLIEKVSHYFKEYEGKEGAEAQSLARDFVDLAREQIGILMERGIGRFAFTHLSLEEYLAARYLSGKERPEEIACNKLYDPRFEEIILLTAAILSGERSERFIKAIYNYDGELDKRFFRRSLLLAAHMIADEIELRYPLKKEILKNFLNTYLSPSYYLKNEALKVIDSLKGASMEGYVIDILLDSIRNGGPDTQWAAAIALGSIGSTDKRVIDALLELVRDKDPFIRGAAIDALGSIGSTDERIISALLELVRDKAPFVQWAAADALGKIGSTDILFELVRDEDPSVQYAAAIALGSIGSTDKRVIDALLELVRDKAPFVQYAAADALGSIGSTSVLLELVRGKAPPVQYAAADALGKIGSTDKRVIDALLELARDKDTSVQEAAAIALGSIGSTDKRVISVLLKLARDININPSVQYAAAIALGRIGSTDERIIDTLLELARNRKAWVRWAAIDALGSIGSTDERIIGVLFKFTKDRATFVREAAIRGLWNIALYKGTDKLTNSSMVYNGEG